MNERRRPPRRGGRGPRPNTGSGAELADNPYREDADSAGAPDSVADIDRTDGEDRGSEPSPRAERQARDERLAYALRENLRRRKEQARERKAPAADVDGSQNLPPCPSAPARGA